VIINHFAVRPGQHWNLEAGLPDAAAHAIHGSMVFSGLASVENQFVDGPDLDFHRWGRLNHSAMPFCIVAPE